MNNIEANRIINDLRLQSTLVPGMESRMAELESACQQWKSEATRLAKLADAFKQQRDRARELAGVVWKRYKRFDGDMTYCDKQMEQRLKAEGVIK